MCVVAAAAVPLMLQVGSAVASGAMGYMAQRQQYSAAMDHRAEQAKQAQETLNQTVNQHQMQYASEVNKAQQEKFKVARASLSARSSASASAAESGVAGLSVNNLLGEVNLEEGMFTAEVDYNTEVMGNTTKNRLKMAERGAQAQLASIPIPEAPSFMANAIGIGANVASIYAKNYQPHQGTPGVHTTSS